MNSILQTLTDSNKSEVSRIYIYRAQRNVLENRTINRQADSSESWDLPKTTTTWTFTAHMQLAYACEQ